tara:strand:+ start:4181 stop:4438 length:258 start_codon:yes stop_codon:yes gene_type:complete
MADAAEAEVPGALIRIAENEPPYIPAAKHETIKINAVSGLKEKETGINKAIAIGGLSPGMAPITRPTETPSNIAKKLLSETIFSR